MEKEQMDQRKEMLVQLINDPTYVPMKFKELCILLQVEKGRREELKAVLDQLVSEGKLGLSAKGKYGKPDAFTHVGIFTANARGFGFVTIEGREDDVFISPDNVGEALHQDKVQIVIMEGGQKGKRTEGRVVRVLEHANKELVGVFQKNKNFGFVIPDNTRITKDIFVPQGSDMGALTGHKVVVTITKYGDEKTNPEGAVVEIIGHVNDPGTDILSIVKAFGLPEEFPDDVMKQAGATADEVPQEDKEGRLDLRALKTVTIDGEDAKDLDDAITLSKDGGMYHLGVHIADVSHYVTENSPLDKEAVKRGTSIYLVDRVIPMLPHKLSNGICSLNAGCDRLALSCLMDIDEKGTVIGHRIAETLINVDERMTYTAVNAIVEDRNPEEMARYQALVPMFDLMKELSGILRAKRKSRGSIDFDFPESKIILDEKCRPLTIKPYERNAATDIIEDFMLMANETVAEDYYWQELPFLYRTHEEPDPDRMTTFGTFINNFGLTMRMPGGEVHPKEIQKLLTKIEGMPEEALISRLALRSMKQAKYTTENTGHFGLAAKYYTHFTSPIRRYPDLQIHRIIKENLKGGLTGRRLSHYENLLPGVAVSSSALERRADEAEREVEKLKKVEYMSKFKGQEFDGVISGVTNWGVYVELPNTVEGMIHVNALVDDYYIFDETHYQLTGEMSHKSYKLGQKIRIVVAATDRLTRTIDFIPADGLGD